MSGFIKRKIVVAMSGGVDSSTVAAILADEGHEVIGITLQLYDVNEVGVKKGTCCAGADIHDAKTAANKIGIPHYVLDYQSKFRQSVIEDFADTYLKGQTPIPCIRCNQTVKFSDLFKVAEDLGADALATGHYVRKIHNNDMDELHQAIDSSKDQSYFLFATTQQQLNFLEFPLGKFKKEYTREMAKKFCLDIADKPDSQDICFVPDGNYKNIIQKLRPGSLNRGNILDTDGKIIGMHDGIINYTIGQRKGIGISGKTPYYVIKINPEDHSIVIGPEGYLKKNLFYIHNTNWLIDPSLFTQEKGITAVVKIRSSHKGCKANITLLSDDKGMYKVELHKEQKSITPGQACVLYDDTRVLGGGWII